MACMPTLDLKKCTDCGLCVVVCRCNALVLVDGVVTVVETEDCGWCGECEAVCSAGAITCPFEIVVEE